MGCKPLLLEKHTVSLPPALTSLLRPAAYQLPWLGPHSISHSITKPLKPLRVRIPSYFKHKCTHTTASSHFSKTHESKTKRKTNSLINRSAILLLPQWFLTSAGCGPLLPVKLPSSEEKMEMLAPRGSGSENIQDCPGRGHVLSGPGRQASDGNSQWPCLQGTC